MIFMSLTFLDVIYIRTMDMIIMKMMILIMKIFHQLVFFLSQSKLSWNSRNFKICLKKWNKKIYRVKAKEWHTDYFKDEKSKNHETN